MERLNQNDFLRVYDELSDAIFRHCYLRVSDRERAKDITQETFIKVWEYAEKGNNITNMRAFVYKIARNLIIDEYRKRKPNVSLENLKEVGWEIMSGNHKEIHDSIDAKELIRVINKIDKKYGDVVIMRLVDDLSPKEIAEISGESENNVSVRINRGIKKIKELLQDEK